MSLEKKKTMKKRSISCQDVSTTDLIKKFILSLVVTQTEKKTSIARSYRFGLSSKIDFHHTGHFNAISAVKHFGLKTKKYILKPRLHWIMKLDNGHIQKFQKDHLHFNFTSHKLFYNQTCGYVQIIHIHGFLFCTFMKYTHLLDQSHDKSPSSRFHQLCNGTTSYK